MRLIDADKIDFNEVFIGASEFAKDTREAAQMLIDNQPTVEAVPVVHGEWIDTQPDYHAGYGRNAHVCSNCNDYYTTEPEDLYFCPRCRADMRKKENKENDES